MDFPVDLPEDIVAKAKELKINPEEVEENFIRGGGHGGQKINKTSSCVQLRHEPTGIEVRCQRHREQSKNRLSAWKLLIKKIEEHVKEEESELAQKRHKIRKQKQRRSRKAKEKMLADKRERSTTKKQRQSVDLGED